MAVAKAEVRYSTQVPERELDVSGHRNAEVVSTSKPAARVSSRCPTAVAKEGETGDAGGEGGCGRGGGRREREARTGRVQVKILELRELNSVAAR